MKELCWLMTTKCNQSCGYCDRFLKEDELNDEEYQRILKKLIEYEVKQITFGGGEALLVDSFDTIVKLASENNIHLKLVTNGKELINHRELIQNLDEITISIDSIDDDVNEQMGRGFDHYQNVCTAFEFIKLNNPLVRVNVNTVVTKYNIDQIENMNSFIREWGISQWRIFRFCPLREKAIKNSSKFEISNDEFIDIKNKLLNLEMECDLQFRNYEDMGEKYLLISPEGKLYISTNMKDIVVGDMLKDNLEKYFNKERG